MFIVNKNGEIYTKEELSEYIESLGFDVEDVSACFSEQEKLFNEIQVLNDICDDFERQCDGYESNKQCAVAELEAVCDILKSGKGLTKAKAAEKIIRIIECYLG